jgi:hypothetical protein
MEFLMDDQRGTMPMYTLVEYLVQDESEDVCGPDNDGVEFSGRGGGELDTDSGVLTLTFTPFEGAETGDDPQEYAPTTVRFVEVERLLAALSNLTPLPPIGHNAQWWREVLIEKLDAGAL